MYLKSFQMKNFRKYREKNNTIMFVDSDGMRRKQIPSEIDESKDNLQIDEAQGEGIQSEAEENKEGSHIDVASATTLVVGKNNAGKTSIIYALLKIIKASETGGFQISDFNFRYLKECFARYQQIYEENKKTGAEMSFKSPFMEFVVTIAFEKESNDTLTNLIPFMLLKDIDAGELDIVLRYEVIEESEFCNAITTALKKIERKRLAAKKEREQKGTKEKTEEKTTGNEFDERKEFLIMLGELEKVRFRIKYYRKHEETEQDEQSKKQNEEQQEEQDTEEVGDKFRISNVMDIKFIRANNVKKDEELSEAFNKIIAYRYDKIVSDKREVLDDKMDSINDDLTESIQEHHSKSINDAVGKIVSSDIMGVDLSANITEEKLVRDLLRYAYVEKGMSIPEGQFGLGYTHLVKIVAELIDYMEHYPDEKCNGRINLIAIEEPESFMHPQMQELFIENINEALDVLVQDRDKNLNSQLLITTHSSHVINSKIHKGNSFDDICYVYEEGGDACIQNLDNASIMPDTEHEKEKDFEFLKKHIKYKVSELFFADAVILVEGFAEETILPFYLEQEDDLSKRYITIFGINGAHAFLYEKLLEKLRIPALIITDLDIDRKGKGGEENQGNAGKETPENADKETLGNDNEKTAGHNNKSTFDKFPQVTELTGLKTTNRTIIHFQDGDDLTNIKSYIEKENIYVTYQYKIGKFYPTSFEEAFILTNADNEVLNDILKSMKKIIYHRIVGKNKCPDYEQNRERSYEWQVKLSDAKGEFASRLLYALVTEPGDKQPELPEYIKQGLKWLSGKLG